MSLLTAPQEQRSLPQWDKQLNEWPYWDEILGFIEEGKCILMLGPEVSISPEQEIPYIHLFAQELKEKLKGQPFTSDKFDSVAEAYIHQWSESLFINKIKRFYRKEEHPGLPHQYISEIPFPLIINTSPDNLLLKCYDNALFDYYDFTQNRDQPAYSGEPQMPLIYNLFGSALKPDSLVITEKDRIEFLVNIIRRNPPIPENIRSEKILNIENMFLFVGFDFNQWYLRLLLKILSLNNKRFAYALENQGGNVHHESKVFYSHNFNLNFLEAPYSVFLKKLRDKYKERNPSLTNIYVRIDPPTTDESKRTKQVMISAALKDQNHVLEIEKMLSPLIVNKKIHTWHSGKIIPGENTLEEIDFVIEKVDILILCLSPDSLIHHMDTGILKRIAERNKEGNKVTIIPLLLRPCMYEEIDLLEKITIHPNDEGNVLPVNDGFWSDSAEALKTVVDILRNHL